MDILKELLKDVPIPKMVRVRQTFSAPRIADVAAAVRTELQNSGVLARIKPGMTVAVAVGSRGVAEIPTIARETVAAIKSAGGQPFIVPAMGSHGGATAEGQQDVLMNLGVTEESAGCPIRSSMEVVEIGQLDNGLPVYIDKNANQADGIVVINRVKPHTAFRGPSESGLVKMITIGLGKQKGAASCHAYSFRYMAENLRNMAAISLNRTPILFGVATVENAYDQVAKVAVIPAENILEEDPKLLIEAKANMPKILFPKFDTLIVDQIGKDISGDGMDPNVTGRYPTPFATGGPEIAKIVLLDLTAKTHGNANGMGAADFATRKLANKVNFPMTYANGLTSTVVGPTHMPTILETDFDAIRAAIKTSNARDITQVKIVRIKNTLSLGDIMISEALLEQAKTTAGVAVVSEPEELSFDSEGNLTTAL